jgi:hypothetical protein
LTSPDASDRNQPMETGNSNAGWEGRGGEVAVGTKVEGVALGSGLKEAVRCSRERYLAELPSLLKDHRGHWVAYAPSGQVALDRDPEKVYQACCRQGLKSGDFLLCNIEPEESSVTEI